uniref:hypothetical protein n=1 Tax=Salmonella sp. s51884 TaxID=3159654 RepID=UPI00397F491F
AHFGTDTRSTFWEEVDWAVTRVLNLHIFGIHTDMSASIAAAFLGLGAVVVAGAHLGTDTHSISSYGRTGTFMDTWWIIADTNLAIMLIDLVSVFTEHHAHHGIATHWLVNHCHADMTTSIGTTLLANGTDAVIIAHVDAST